jgi:putative membrane protein
LSEATPNPTDPHNRLAGERTHLATFRTQLALDRTTLAWIRTTLTMASFGIGLVAFFRSLREESPTEETRRLHEGAVNFGVALIVLGLVATVLAGLSHWFTLRRLRHGDRPILRQWPLSITVAMLLAVLCLAGLWLLFVR